MSWYTSLRRSIFGPSAHEMELSLAQAQLEVARTELEQARVELQSRQLLAERAVAELAVVEEALESYDDNARAAKLSSDEPWVEVLGDRVNSDGMIHIQLDWNDAFIRTLKANGFKGQEDEDIVRKWLAAISQVVSDDIEEQLVEQHGTTPNNHYA